MGRTRPDIVQRNNWDARYPFDREAIREYANGKLADASNCPPSLVLHLLDVIDGLQ